VTDLLRIDRLALGPQEGGRGFGVIAASPGLTLPNKALSEIQDYNLRIGEYVVEDLPIHACFPVSVAPKGELWFLSSTVVHGRQVGNVVWVTWGAVLTRKDMDRLEGRTYRLLGRLHGDVRPAVGETLPPLEVAPAELTALPGAAPNALDCRRYAGKIGRVAAALRVHEPMVALATLDALLEAVPPPRRRAIGFVTAPIPVRQWQLVSYQDEAWRDGQIWLPVDAETLKVDKSGISGGQPASVAETVWDGVMEKVAADPEWGGRSFAEQLGRYGPANGPEDEPEAALAACFGELVEAVVVRDGEEAALRRFGQLLGAALALDSAFVEPAARALLRMWEGRLSTASKPAAWFMVVFDQAPALRRAARMPTQMPARLAVERGLIFELEPAVLDALGPALVTIFCAPLIRQAMRAPPGRGDADVRLLEMLLPSLTSRGRQLDQAWDLANKLGSRLVAGAAAVSPAGREGLRESVKKVLVELLETIVRMRRADGVLAMFNNESRARLRILFGADDFHALIADTRSAATRLLDLHAWKFAFVVHERVRP
jgi:hypothetical protein